MRLNQRLFVKGNSDASTLWLRYFCHTAQLRGDVSATLNPFGSGNSCH